MALHKVAEATMEEHMNKEGDLNEMETKSMLILNIWRKHLKFLENVMKKSVLEYLTLVNNIEVKCEREKNSE